MDTVRRITPEKMPRFMGYFHANSDLASDLESADRDQAEQTKARLT
eukprot:CAMPEP_0172390728 /NCGR_PEP_ID=MMETSP1061-20121228/7316_1 /TAXON_ID=37318 /ORGANISM="Pseudo-nitzschia pungens, Strain cf. pungens" /LENGTH=45 /DNA_ID= /DNA_START= /DNA_END= /DNA_ORIENTATION=